MEIYKLLTKKKILLLLFAIYICTLVLFARENPAYGKYDEDSFSEKNIEKTKNDFSKIADTNITELSGLALENYFRFEKADIAIFIGTILMALACPDERNKALQCVLHTCSKGCSG